MIQGVFLGFISVFTLHSFSLKNNKNLVNFKEDINTIEQDLYLSYKKLQNYHERKKAVL